MRNLLKNLSATLLLGCCLGGALSGCTVFDDSGANLLEGKVEASLADFAITQAQFANVEKAIRGMIPKTTLGRQQMTKLKVYRGAEHPHAAQQPKPFEITQVAQ